MMSQVLKSKQSWSLKGKTNKRGTLQPVQQFPKKGAVSTSAELVFMVVAFQKVASL